MFTTHLIFAIYPLNITPMFNNYLSLFTSYTSDVTSGPSFSLFTSFISTLPWSDSLDLTGDYYFFIEDNLLLHTITVIFTFLVLLSNIADLLNPLTFEENQVAVEREQEFKKNKIMDKLRYQKAYTSANKNRPFMNIWWRGWNVMPEAKLTPSEEIFLMNLPTSKTYFQNAGVLLFPNRFEGLRPGIKSCPKGAFGVPVTAKVWLIMDEEQP